MPTLSSSNVSATPSPIRRGGVVLLDEGGVLGPPGGRGPADRSGGWEGVRSEGWPGDRRVPGARRGQPPGRQQLLAAPDGRRDLGTGEQLAQGRAELPVQGEIGRASCREGVWTAACGAQ